MEIKMDIKNIISNLNEIRENLPTLLSEINEKLKYIVDNEKNVLRVSFNTTENRNLLTEYQNICFTLDVANKKNNKEHTVFFGFSFDENDKFKEILKKSVSEDAYETLIGINETLVFFNNHVRHNIQIPNKTFYFKNMDLSENEEVKNIQQFPTFVNNKPTLKM